MSRGAESSDSSPCDGCRARFFCIIDVFNGRRDQVIVDCGEASEVELAFGVIREREEFLVSLRQDLESQLKHYRLGMNAAADV